MNKHPHSPYQDYPEQPFIAPDRDLDDWLAHPENYPYGPVERRQMIRLPEGVLPGDIILLWRIHFDNFTTASVIPAYFEYRYGVDAATSFATLERLGYARMGTPAETLDILTISQLKKILATRQLPLKGKRAELLTRAHEHFAEAELVPLLPFRKYKITPAGSALLSKYGDIVKKHGPKQ